MTRVKGGIKGRASHNKVLKLAKGYRMTRSKHIKSAIEAVLHAGEYAFAGRKDKKSNFRRLWIIRLNAALRAMDLTYSSFIKKLKDKNIELDRKVLSQLAVEEPVLFKKIVEKVNS